MMGTPKACPVFRTGWNYDRDAASAESGVDCGCESLVQQEFKDEVDVNNIVARFIRTGELPEPVGVAKFGDFTGIPDFQTALHLVRDAEASFMALDPKVRARFDNDPGKLLEFVETADESQLIELGIKLKPAAAPPEAIPPSPVPKE